MITTVTQMYLGFLDGIKKEVTSIVEPSQFNRIINVWGQEEWIKENALAVEFNQKQIDDLDKIRCATDAVFDWNNAGVPTVLFPFAPLTTSDKIFEIPKYNFTGLRNRQDDGQIQTQDYPRYLRMLNVQFKIQYGANQECGLTGISDWTEATIMRSDQRTVILKNPLRQPKDTRLYYELIDGKIRLITGTDSLGYALRMEYLRYPVEIFFDANDVAHVNCEFAPQQQKEIVDIAVRVYLERVKDPRYQSFLNEEAIKSISK